MRLTELFERSGVTPDGIFSDAEIGVLNDDTRTLLPGETFVAMPSARSDAHSRFEEAKLKGASALIAHSNAGFEHAIRFGAAAYVDQVRMNDALWRLARTSYDAPSHSMKVVGVTGTNGKTTVAWLIRDALNALDVPTGYLGTLGVQYGSVDRFVGNTTPFAVGAQRLIAECLAGGSEALAMEVSSHALEQQRADGVEFDAAVFTNLTQDHLDYHLTMEAYEAAKWRLFQELPRQSDKRFVAAFNVDDPTGERWSKAYEGEQISFGLTGGELRGMAVDVRIGGLRLDLTFRGVEATLHSRLGGEFNVFNNLAAVAGLLALGYGLEGAVDGLTEARPVPGRFEAVLNDTGIGVIVDYAHTPDALEKLIHSARALGPKRVVVVFGCGGDRDRTKRPKMASAVSRAADVTVITSDNPRTEDPQAILDEVVTGIVPGREFVAILDRAEAVTEAIRRAQPGDLVVIAGKGHENYQIIGHEKIHMDDRELAIAGLEARR